MDEYFTNPNDAPRWDVNYIYIDGPNVFFSPDSIGRIFFDSLEEAKAETGLTKTIVIGYP